MIERKIFICYPLEVEDDEKGDKEERCMKQKKEERRENRNQYWEIEGSIVVDYFLADAFMQIVFQTCSLRTMHVSTRSLPGHLHTQHMRTPLSPVTSPSMADQMDLLSFRDVFHTTQLFARLFTLMREREKNPLNDRRNTSNIRAREMTDVKLLRIT